MSSERTAEKSTTRSRRRARRAAARREQALTATQALNRELRHMHTTDPAVWSSGWEYDKQHPRNLRLTNLQVYTAAGLPYSGYGTVWAGDLDLSIDEGMLIEMAAIAGERLYVMGEHDCNPELALLLVDPDGTVTVPDSQWMMMARGPDGRLRSNVNLYGGPDLPGAESAEPFAQVRGEWRRAVYAWEEDMRDILPAGLRIPARLEATHDLYALVEPGYPRIGAVFAASKTTKTTVTIDGLRQFRSMQLFVAPGYELSWHDELAAKTLALIEGMRFPDEAAGEDWDDLLPHYDSVPLAVVCPSSGRVTVALDNYFQLQLMGLLLLDEHNVESVYVFAGEDVAVPADVHPLLAAACHRVVETAPSEIVYSLGDETPQEFFDACCDAGLKGAAPATWAHAVARVLDDSGAELDSRSVRDLDESYRQSACAFTAIRRHQFPTLPDFENSHEYPRYQAFVEELGRIVRQANGQQGWRRW